MWAFARGSKFFGTRNRFVLDVRKACRYDGGNAIVSAGDTAMAKLEELVTPSELVAAIRDGAAKDELVKTYKASEQELAMMLLPLYRRGEFTKEEFNNFFKGVPVKRDDEPQSAHTPFDAATTQPEFEPPSEILRSLSKAARQVENEADTFSGSETATAEESYEESIVSEPAEMKDVLDMILAKVTSIDVRLSEIEKKLGSQ